jgi:hypothetical protein
MIKSQMRPQARGRGFKKKKDFKGHRLRKFENPWSKVTHKNCMGIT